MKISQSSMASSIILLNSLFVSSLSGAKTIVINGKAKFVSFKVRRLPKISSILKACSTLKTIF